MKVQKVVFAEYEIFYGSVLREVKQDDRYSFLYWLTSLAVNKTYLPEQYLYRNGDRCERFYFIQNGEVSFVLEYKAICFFKLKSADCFGLEDYIYKMPVEPRLKLNDNVYFFADHEIRIWYKRKFKVRANKSTTLITVSLQ
jgi:CRP-like cAMP-binding protein